MTRNLLVNRKPIDGPWGGGNQFVRTLFENAPSRGYKIVTSLDDIASLHAVLVVDPRYDELGISAREVQVIKSSNPHVKVIHRVNECDARKGLVNDIDPMLRFVSSFSDVSVFISSWLRQHHQGLGWFCEKTEVVGNGVDGRVFFPGKTSTSETASRNVMDDPIRIVTHHWSNNRMKGFDVYEAIDKWVGSNPNFTFTYVGRELGTFKNTRTIPPKWGIELGDLLRSFDVYISGSLFDPGPNHVSESLACGLPTYVHELGGGGAEMAGPDHTFRTADELIGILASGSYSSNEGSSIRDWKDQIMLYFDIIDRELGGVPS